jgi:hypothetical protein
MSDDSWEFVSLTEQDEADLGEVEAITKQTLPAGGDKVEPMRLITNFSTVARILEAHGFQPNNWVTGTNKDGRPTLRGRRLK